MTNTLTAISTSKPDSASATASIPLATILSIKSQNALRGICSEEWKSGQDGKTFRTPRHAFGDALRDLYGNFNFCKVNGIPFDGDVDVLLNELRWQLGVTEAFQASVLADQSTDDFLPAISYTKQGLAGVWRKIFEISPTLYEELCPPMEKRQVTDAIAKAQNRSWPSVQPSEEGANLNLESSQQALAFRNSLAVGLIREWSVAVQVFDPFNADLVRRIEEFRSKFANHGYYFSGKSLRASEGLTQLSADSLLRVKASFDEYVPRFREALAAQVECIYSQYVSQGVAIYSNAVVVKQMFDLFVLPASSELNSESDPMDLTLASKMKIQNGEIVRNRLPVAIAAMICGFSA